MKFSAFCYMEKKECKIQDSRINQSIGMLKLKFSPFSFLKTLLLS